MKNRPTDILGNPLYVEDLCHIVTTTSDPDLHVSPELTLDEDGSPIEVLIQSIHSPHTAPEEGSIYVIPVTSLLPPAFLPPTRLLQVTSTYANFAKILSPVNLAAKLKELPLILFNATASKAKTKRATKKVTKELPPPIPTDNLGL